MMKRSGWYRWRKSFWHFFDNAQSASLCGALVFLPQVKRIRIFYSDTKPKQGETQLDRVCLHCERMMQ